MEQHDIRQEELEEKLAEFEQENPELSEAIKLMGQSIEEYNIYLLNTAPEDIVTTNTSGG